MEALNSLSVTSQLKTEITSQSRLFPRGVKERDEGGLSLIRRGVVGRRAGPANIPFQSDGERDHPSVGLLRIFMTGWCHSGYSLAGLRHRNPRRSETLMTRRVSWLEGTTETKRQDETDAGMQIAS